MNYDNHRKLRDYAAINYTTASSAGLGQLERAGHQWMAITVRYSPIATDDVAVTVTIVDDGVPTTILLCEMDLIVTLIHTAVDGESTDVVTPQAADVATAINLEVNVHRVSPALLVPTAPRTAHFRSVFFFSAPRNQTLDLLGQLERAGLRRAIRVRHNPTATDDVAITVTIVDNGVPTTILLCEMDLVTLIHTAVDGESTDVVTPRAADVATAINLEVYVHRVSPALLVPTAP